MDEKEILLVRQRHEAERAGLHFDYRIVIGEKAYSWATKKDLPEPGKSIVLHEQPVHDSKYALSEKIEIPKGEYGAGVTTLDKTWKGKARIKDKEYLLTLNNGDRFFLKHMPSYGPKQWLFVNITGKGQDKKAEQHESIYDRGEEQYNYLKPHGRINKDSRPNPEQEAVDEATSSLLRMKTFVHKELKNPLQPVTGGTEQEKKAYIQRTDNLMSNGKPKPPTKQELEAQDNSISGQKHQTRVVEKLKQKHPRLLAFHGLGSGKTLTGLMAARQAQKDGKEVTFITPAGLTKNIEKEMKKHKITLDKKRTKTLSYEMAVKKKDELLSGKGGLLVLDEAHKLREKDTTRFQELEPVLKKYEEVLMLSGSPLYNEPKNISTLVNTLAKDKVLPEKTEDFEQQFINRKKIDPGFIRRFFLGVKPSSRAELKNQAYLKNVFDQYIDYYEPDEQAKAFYPKVEETEIKVPMSSEQQKVYDFLEGSLPGHVKWMVRMGLPPDKKTSKDLNAFSSGLRQASNSHAPFKRGMKPGDAATPKLERAVSNLVKRNQEDKNFRGLVYSNYLKAGIEPYAAMLDKLGIKYEIISGELPMKKRQEVVKNYNSGKTKVLLLSSAGGEGLDLKGTKLIQIMEPHWNAEKIKQVIGRGVRYKSHEHLPTEEKKVQVEHYLSTTKQTAIDKLFRINPKSMDEYLRDRMNDKDQFNDQVKDLLRKGQKEGN